MAFTHIQFDDQKQHGRYLRRALQHIEEGYDTLLDIIATMTTMIDGDGSSDAQFSEVTTRFGFGSNADAKAAWDELNSLKSKLVTDDSVSFVNAAMLQAFNKFR